MFPRGRGIICQFVVSLGIREADSVNKNQLRLEIAKLFATLYLKSACKFFNWRNPSYKVL